MVDYRTAPYAALLLRLSLGLLFLAHASLKLFVFTPAGFVKFFASLGLPAPLAYLIMAAETIGAVALILGLYTRWVAPALSLILIGAIALVHGANGWMFTAKGGGWEFPALWAVALFVQAILGDGAYALKLPGLGTSGSAAAAKP